MEDKVIEIIKETIKLSDLTDREKQIYEIGYADGIFNKWSKPIVLSIVISLLVWTI
jgi:hypothetical protein